MANRYWVGGSGTWDLTTTTHWSATSGGSGGASVPIETDNVFFDANSSATSYTLTVPDGSTTVPYCLSLSVSGPASGTLTFGYATAFNGNLSVYDSATFAATGVTISSRLAAFYIGGSSGAGTLTTNGNFFYSVLYVNYLIQGSTAIGFSSGTVSLGSALSISGSIAPQSPNSTGNGFNTNGYALSCGNIYVYGSANISNSTVTCSGTFGAVGGATINCGNSSITLTGAVPYLNSSYTGAGIAFNNVNYTGSGTLTIDSGGNNSFNTLSNIGATTTQTFTFPAGKTQTIGNLSLNGASGRLITLASSTTSAYTITRKTSGTNSCSYCSVSYMTGTSTATGGGSVVWRFSGSTDGGNNTNLTFAITYYWVGGTGTWDATSNTHWSLTSGGTGNVGPPTSSDDVVFNSSSSTTAYTVTVAPTFVGTASFSTITSMTTIVTVATVTSGTLAVGDIFYFGSNPIQITSFGTGSGGAGTYNCNVLFGSNGTGFGTVSVTASRQACGNIIISGPASGSLTFSTTTGSLVQVSGGITTAATGVSTNFFNIVATGSSVHTITTNSLAISNNLTLAGTGTYTLGSALTITGSLQTSTGTFTTGNYALTINSFDQSSSGTRTINLGSSTVTINLGGYPLGSSWGSAVTLNAGTSTLNITGSYSYVIPFGSKTWYNVALTSTSINSTYGHGLGASGETNTFNNFTIAGQTLTGVFPIWIEPSMTSFTVNGTFTIGSATNATCRLMIKSGNYVAAALGTTKTLTLAAFAAGATDVDWQDIAIAGAAGTISGTRFGDCGGNSGITFAAGKTVYWNLSGVQNWSATGWATSSGGSPAAANFPLAQDTAIFNNTGSAGTVTIDNNWNIGSVDMSSRTSAMTLSNSTNAFTVYGSWTNGSGTTLSGTGTITFSNRAIKTINSAGVTFTQPITINALGGTVQLLTNNLNNSSAVGITLTRGTIDLNNLSITAAQFICSTSGTTTALAFGTTGSINLTGNNSTILQILFSTFTYTGTSQINLTYSGSTGTRSFNVNQGANSPTIKVTAGTDTVELALNSGYSIGSINFTGFTGSLATSTNSVTLYGNLTLGTGMTASGYTGTMTFAGAGCNITTNGVSVACPVVVNAAGAIIQTVGAFTSSSTWTISDSTSLFFVGGTFTVSTFSSSSTGQQDFSQNYIITGAGAAYTQSVTRSGATFGATSYISMTSASPKTFAGGGSLYCGLNQGGSGALTITGSNTFYNAGIQNTVQPATIIVTAGTTQTVSKLNLNGTSGNLITLGSTTTSAFTITRSTAGVNTCTYCSVSYMTGNTSSSTVLWRFLNSTNGGNNTNLTFASLYYWVGGSGTWNNSSTTNWSLTSGGAGAQGPPTANDDVVFDSASNATAYTVTTGTSPACFNITVNAPASGKVTLNTSAGTLSIYGSLNFAAGTSGMVLATSSNIIFAAQYAGNTITTNGIQAAGSGYSFNGLNGVWTLGSDIWAYAMVITNGTLNTSTNNYKITGFANIQFPSGTNGIVLNGSTVETAGWLVSGNPTITAGTSTIKLAGISSANFQGVGKTYYNLELNSSASPITISGSNIFNNISNNSQPLTINFTAGTTQTVANLNLNGTSGNLITLGSTTTSAYTITKTTAGVNTCTYCSVSYMTGTTTATGGGSVIWRFLNSTNGGNNTNLTFANIYYWVGGSGTWNSSSTTNWSLTSGGAGAQGPPTANDDVIFDANSNATSYTVTITGSTTSDSALCYNFSVTSGPASGTVTFNGSSGGSASLMVFGNFTLTSSISLSFNLAYIYLLSTSTSGATLTSGGFGLTSTTFVMGYYPNTGGAPASNYTLSGALTCNSLFVDAGTFDTSSTGNYTLTLSGQLSAINSGSGLTLNFNASTITILSSIIVGSSGTTVNAGTSTINLTGLASSTHTIQFGNKTYYNVVLNNGNNSGVTYNITDGVGTNTFNTFTYKAASAAPSLNSLVLSGNLTMTGIGGGSVFSLNTGSTANNRLFVRSSVLGTQRTITTGGAIQVNCDYRDITGSFDFVSALNGAGDCGGNSVITFPAAKTVYWNLAGSQNWSATGWATSSGGTPAAANFPLAQDTVVFDNTGSAGTVTIDNNWNIGAISTQARTTAMTLATGTTTPIIYGPNWYNGTGLTITGTGKITFSNRSLCYIFGNGVSFTQPIEVDAPGGGIQPFNGNLTFNNSLTLTRGTLQLATFTLTCQSFSSTNTNTRTIAFGTGQINVTGNNSIVWNTSTYTGLTITGTPTVNFTYSGSIGARDIRGPDNGSGSGASSPLINANITAGSDIVYLDSGISGNYSSVNFTGFTGTWYIVNGVSIYGNLTLCTGMTNSVTVADITFRATAGSQAITTNGVTINVPIVINAPGAVLATNDAFTSTSSFSINSYTPFYPGGSLTVSSYYSASTTYAYYNYTFTITGSGACFTQVNVAAGVNYDITTPITLTSSSPKTFAGGGSSFGRINQGGTGALTISGNNTFAGITNSVQPSTITFTAGTTQTVTLFGVKGTAGNLVTLNSTTPGTRFTISQSSGKNILSYLSIQDSAVTGGAKFFAGATSTNVSNNLGWIFANPANPLSINSAGVLSTPNIFDETQVLAYTPYVPTTKGSILFTQPSNLTTSNSFLQTANTTILGINSTNDFTIECWANISVTPTGYPGIFELFPGPSALINGWGLSYNSTTPSGWFVSYGPSGHNFQNNTTISLNTWYHLALVRKTNVLYLYVNGIQQTNNSLNSGFFENDTNYQTSQSLLIGNSNLQYSPGFSWPGTITDFRVVIGTAVYSSNFTSPTNKLTAIANTAVLYSANPGSFLNDSSTNNLTLTSPNGGVSFSANTPTLLEPATTIINVTERTTSTSYQISGILDETQTLTYTPPGQTAPGSIQLANTLTTSTVSNNYVTTANSSVFALTSTQDFTIECWVKFNSFNSDSYIQQNIIQLYPTSGPAAPYYSYQGYTLSLYGPGYSGGGISGIFFINFSGGGLGIFDPALNTWYHLTYTRYNGNLYYSINGNYVDAVNPDNNSFTSALVRLGGGLTYSNPDVEITNVRVTIGTALYTSNFTPPTAPLTKQANTVLLLTMNNSSSYLTDSSNSNLSVTAPHANVSFNTASPFTFTPATVPVAKRIDKNGNLYVSGYLDEFNPQ